MASCPRCGNEYQAGSNFCGNCGVSITEKATTGCSNQTTAKDCFGFRIALNGRLIKSIYILGAAILMIMGLVFLYRGSGEAILGLVLLLFGNLLWTIFCEMLVLTYAIREGIVPIDQKIEEIKRLEE